MIKRYQLLALTLCLLGGIHSNAQSWTQIGGDIDGEAAGDVSGISVSLSSDVSTMAIGATNNDGNGTNSGHVRIYKNISGTWTQVGADIDGEAVSDASGISISLNSDGSTVAIGAGSNDGNGSNAGHVRIYKNISDTWTQIGADIDGESSDDQSGRAVSISNDGNIVAVGATGNDGNGSYAGHVRVYQNISGSWTQIGADIDGEAAGDVSGYSISLSGDGSTVAIGAPQNDGNGSDAGHVRVYKNINGTWTQVGADIDGEASNDWFGSSVSLSTDGGIVAIGARRNDGNGAWAGHVRIYKNDSGSWTQIGADIDGEAAGDQSGVSVSLSSDGSMVAIGAYGNDGNGAWAGHVRIYKNDSGSWTQIGADIDGEAMDDYSGYSVSLSTDGSMLAIGAYRNDGNGISAGHVRVFNLCTTTFSTDTITSCGPYTWIDGVTYTTSNYTATDTLVSTSGCDSIITLNLTVIGNWTQVGSDIDGESVNDHSGYSVSLSTDGSTVAIGAPYNGGNGNGSGHVRIYKNVSGTWTQVGSDIDGEAAGDNSGYSVSLSTDGSIVAIGAPGNSPNGHVRVYKNTNGNWIQVGSDIDGEAFSDLSGISVSLSGDGSVVAIGASRNNGNGSLSGHVRIYENNNGNWTQVGVDIDGEAAYDYSGRSVSLSKDGNTVAIGAYFNDGNGDGAGHVRVYENINGTWTKLGLDIDGEAADDYSGFSVSLNNDGSVVAIGATGNDGNGSRAGHVRVYKMIAANWTQIGSDIDGKAIADQSGYSVSLSSDGSTVAIGANSSDGNGVDAGQVSVYRFIGNDWIQVSFDINGESSDDESGFSVSLSSDGNTLAIGARNNDGSGSDAGHTRVYNIQSVGAIYSTDTITSCGPYTWIDGVTYTTSNYSATDTLVSASGCDSIVTLHLSIPSTWNQVGLDIDGEATFDQSGRSVSLSSDGSVMAIGGYVNDGNGIDAGHVRVYKNLSGIWSQVGSDIDGESAQDRSGECVSLSSDGSTVAIGAIYNDGNGTDAGHVRVYKNINNSWIQVGSDIDGEAASDWFGYSVSLSNDGNTLAVGGYTNDGNGTDAGHVRIYKNINGTWIQLGTDIDGEAAGDHSGYSVSLNSDGSVVAIGAPFNDDNGTSSGHVRVYKNLNGTWTQQGLDIDGEAVGDGSGFMVSLSGDGSIVAIGSPYNDGNGIDAGHVRIYENINGTWTQVGADIDGEAAGDRSGWSFSLNGNGNTVAVGAIYNDGNGTNAGHVRIYSNINGIWTQQGSDIDGESSDDWSGYSVSLSNDGSTAAIGAIKNDGNGTDAGHVRVFKIQGIGAVYSTDTITSCGPYTWIDGVTYSTSNYTATDTLVSASGCDSIVTLHLTIPNALTGNWIQVGTDIDGEAAGDYSGYSVSLSSDGSTVAIGALYNDGNGTDAGHVRIYKNINGTWTQVGADIDGEATIDQSGCSVSLSSDGSTVAIGAPYNDGNGTDAGHVRIYKNINGTWTQVGADIDGEAGSNYSGRSVSLSSDGSTVAVGAPSNGWGYGHGSGHVRVYNNVNGTWTQVGSDIDGEAAGDYSGGFVSLSSDGNTVAIGALDNDGNGTNAGHVRVYNNVNGTWTQVGSDIDGEAAGDYSGSVSLSNDGSTVAIGALNNDGNGADAGHVRIYKNINGTWTQVGADIDGEAADDRSGFPVSLSDDGNTVAIGALNNDGNGTNAGHVRIYKNINGTWTQVGSDIDGEAPNDLSGCSVSLSSDGSTVAIGAYNNGGNGSGSGHVRVYNIEFATYITDTITSCGPYTWIDGVTYTTSNYTATDTLVSASGCDSIVTLHLTIPNSLAGNWIQVGADIDGEAAGDNSGGSVSLSSDGSTVAIGARNNDGNGTSAGHVRIYKNTNGTWTQVGADIDGEAAVDRSGESVSLSSDGSTLAIGAPYNDGNGTDAGHVRIYNNVNGTWTQVGADIDGEAADDQSGRSVSLSSDGSTVAIGAPWNNGNGFDAGHVRVYKNFSGTWTQVGADIDGEAAGDQSGCSVSLSSDGSTVAIGAPYNDGNGTAAGRVRIFKNTSGTWTQVGADIDGEAAGDYSGWSVSLSSDGNTVAIGAHGNDGNGTDAGHVRIYKNISGTWTQVGTDIDGESAGDAFGYPVSLSSDGSTLAIGATSNDGNGTGAGHVRVYKNINGSWTQVGADIDGETGLDQSGCSVSLSSDGSTVAIGANLNDGNGTNAGHVRVYHIESATYITDTITSCGPYTWIDGVTYTTGNDTATDTILSAAGCDSAIVTLHLTINSSNTGTDTITACDSYTWIDGNTYTASNNTATFTLTNAAGCDSVVTLDLTINSSNTGTDLITACDSYTWIDGNTYTASNNSATYTLTNAAGCDSVVTLDLTINSSNTGTDVITACDSYTWIDGLTYTASNNSATYTLTNAAGCDSVVTLDLTINSSNTGTDVITACDSYTWIDGNTYTVSNNSATYTLTNAAGCDSVVTLDLTINSSNTGTDVITACDSYTWIDGNTYTTSNNSATYTLTNAAGCDSVVTLDLTINSSNTGTDVITACDSYTWIDGNTYTASNNSATYTLTNAAGCDSVVTLDLTINSSNTGTDVITACDSYTWIDGNTYTASNNSATYTLTNAAGCDSVVTLDLTINSSNTGIDVITACDSYTWIDGNTYTASNNSATYVLNNVNGCDSVVSLDLTITYSNTGQVSLNGCDQVSLNGQTYTVSGTYIQNLVNSDGCDSILTINANITYSNFIQSQPTNQSVGEGLNAVFLIVGPPTAQYQWQTNLGLGYQNLNDFGQYSGTTTSSLQVSNVNLLINNNQAFRCLVTEGNCTDTSGTVILEVVPSSSVNEFEQGINIYPNPTQGIVKVELKNSTSTNDIYQLQLVDSHGKLIQNSPVNFQDGFIVINIEDYPAGVYQLTLKNQYEVFHEKISKVH